MFRLRGPAAALGLALLAVVALASAGDRARGKKVDYALHSGYFEKNNSGLTGESSYLALATKKDFDKVFGVAFIAGAKQKFLPKSAFETRLVAAAIKRGTALWSYTVDKVTADGGTLFVEYKAKRQTDSKGATRFASPLILSVERDKLSRVVFIENGKKVGTAAVAR
jgi:hypothetical protein